MDFSRKVATIGGLSVLASTAMGTVVRAEIGKGLRDIAEGLDDTRLAMDAYVFG
jgi:hypothetical protein